MQRCRRFTSTGPDSVRYWARALTSLFFIVAGWAHFRWAGAYTSIVPAQFGNPDRLVALSGVAEIAGGIGLLLPPTRRAAGIGLIVLLFAVWPANWYMAVKAERFASMAPGWLLWLRVPLQVPLIWWVERASR